MLSNAMPNPFAFAFGLSPRFELSRDYGAIGDSPSIGGDMCSTHSLMLPKANGNINQYRVPCMN